MMSFEMLVLETRIISRLRPVLPWEIKYLLVEEEGGGKVEKYETI